MIFQIMLKTELSLESKFAFLSQKTKRWLETETKGEMREEEERKILESRER